MYSKTVVTVAPGGTGIIDENLDFQSGDLVVMVIPVDDDEGKVQSTGASFAAAVRWSNEGNLFVTEPIFDSAVASSASTGEVLFTPVKAPKMQTCVVNQGASPQRFYVSAYIPGTPT